MRHFDSPSRATVGRGALALSAALSIAVLAGQARAESAFAYAGKPVHPACIQALAMHQGDSLPVTTAVNLEGCATSERSRSEVHYDGDIVSFEDDALLGGGSFGYRVITQLDNGIYGLAIRRIQPDGEERVSLAAVSIAARPMMLNSRIVNVQMLELLGELWIPGMDLTSFQSIGNRVHFVAGTGTERVERNVDFTRLGRMRK